MSSKNKSKSAIRTILLLSFVLVSLAISGCISEPEVCNYDQICTQDETDNCVDCKNVLGRDVKDITGNVIYPDNSIV